MMTSHGKLRREKGSLAEYESQMKGKPLRVSSVASVALLFCALTCTRECIRGRTCAFMHIYACSRSAQTLSRTLMCEHMCTCELIKSFSVQIHAKSFLKRGGQKTHKALVLPTLALQDFHMTTACVCCGGCMPWLAGWLAGSLYCTTGVYL